MSIGTFDETFFVRKLSADLYQVTKFGDSSRVTESKEPHSVFTVNTKNKQWRCSCPGFRVQKNLAEHKHFKLVNYFINELKEVHGSVIWFDNNEICSREFFNE